ncbi:MAG: hypothetical protein SOZ15_09190, partial [[Ruminococcus] torques]|uniref:hypothetical protein n=3 Tax=[Ruminococcus] torques TaxID=33039 RepID=UPI00242C3596
KRLMTVSVFSCSCDNVILPSFIALIEYQKETKPQVNLKETLSQVNNSEDTGMVAYLFFTCYTFTRKPSGKTPF